MSALSTQILCHLKRVHICNCTYKLELKLILHILHMYTTYFTHKNYIQRCKCRLLILSDINISICVFSKNRIFYSVTQAFTSSSNMPQMCRKMLIFTITRCISNSVSNKIFLHKLIYLWQMLLSVYIGRCYAISYGRCYCQ